MKKAVVAAGAVFWAVFLFFSIFGERLYYITKPKVELSRAVYIGEEAIVPVSAVFRDAGGYCLVAVESEQGFSTEILTTKKIRLIAVSRDQSGYFGDGYAAVLPASPIRAPIVIKTTRDLKGGQRVVEEEG